MSDIIKSNQQPINIRLIHTNYPQWKPAAEIFLKQKPLIHHIIYSSFEVFREATFKTSNIQEKKYFAARKLILDKPITINYTQDQQDDELLTLQRNENYKDDFKSFEKDYAKAKEKWDNEETQMEGFYSSCIDISIWQDCRCLKSAYAVWEYLKRATGQLTTSNWLTSIRNFYDIHMKQNETLSSFAARVIQANNSVIEIGNENIIFQPLHVVSKIVSCLPDNPNCLMLSQRIHAMEPKDLTLEYVQTAFIEEDSRIQNLIKSNQESKKEQANQTTTSKSRKCIVSNCKNIIAAEKPAHISRCPSCHTIFKKEAEERKKDSTDKTKVAATIVLSTNPTSTEKINPYDLYLDSAATSHVVNDYLPMDDLEICEKMIAGPTGEITLSTFKGTHKINIGGQDIEFRNALVVPSLERNLLSVAKISQADPSISTIFNQNKFQVFQGEISLKGRTLFQGQLDDSGLYKVSSILDESATREAAEVGRAVAAKVELLETYPEKKIENLSPDHMSLPLDTIEIDCPDLRESTGTPTLSIDAPDTVAEAFIANTQSRGIFPNSIFSISNTEPGMARYPMPKFSEFIVNVAKQPANTLQQWHLNLGHLGKKKIKALADSNFLKIVESDDIFECSTCDAAKMRRKAFAKAMPPKAANAGEVLHSDVCGKITPATYRGERYIVTFIDELSGYIHVRLLKNKSEVFQHFKEFRALLNNQNATTSVKIFVSDGGGEYINTEFQDFLKENGVSHVKTPPNTPQRNGKSERLNKILFDLARAMLKHRQIPRRFWGEAVLYAAYIINRMPKSGNDQVRLEMIFGRKPSFDQMLEFGTPVMFHNHDPHIKKLDDRAFEGMFIGFHEDDHTYKILKTSTNEVISTRTIHPYPQEILSHENNDWDQKFTVEDDDHWQTGLTDQPQYRLYDQYQSINNDSPYNNNINNQSFLNANNNASDISNQQVDMQNELSQQQIDNDVYDDDDDDQPTNFHIRIPFHEQILDQEIVEQPYEEIQQDDDDDVQPDTLPTHNYNTRSKGPIHKVLSVVEIERILQLADLEAPRNYREAINSSQSKEWKEAISVEHQSLIDHGTFEIVDRPLNKKPITSRHVFKIKTDDKGVISKFKARLVARGYNQTYGEDYFEVFSPTLRMDSVRFLIATAAKKSMRVHHLDVETAFLNGNLEEEIYLEIPDGFEEYDRTKKCFKLKKAIYGLKQASRAWNKLFTSKLLELGFRQSIADPCIFIRGDTYIGVFVDDCFVVGGDKDIEEIKHQLMSLFKMHNLGPLSFALGIRFNQQEDFSIKMSQSLYIDKILEKFSMTDCRTTKTPLPIKANSEDNSKPLQDINRYQQLIGSLIYLSNSTRPDIAYAVSYLARSMHAPTEADFTCAKRVLRYLKEYKNFALNYNDKQQQLFAFSDSSYAEEKDRKSVGGYVTMMSGAALTWKSTKQSIIAQSSMEAEYIALAETAKEIEWLRKLQKDIFSTSTLTPTIIFEDNQSTIKLSKNPIHSKLSKHIDVRYHKVQELVANKIINVQHKPTTEMVADIMTKSLHSILHHRFASAMGLVVDDSA